MKIFFQILLAVIIAFLGYQVFQSINKPLEFKKIKKEREQEVIAKLKDIRAAQQAYVLAHGKYTSSFDTLENFIKEGNIPLIKRTGTLTDEMLADGIDEKKAIKLGKIKIDTIKVPVMDTLFKNRANFDASQLKYVPGMEKQTFQMAAKELESESGLKVPVFEVKVDYDDLFKDLREGDLNKEYRADTMELNRLKKYPGLKVGSLEEANDAAGNWE